MLAHEGEGVHDVLDHVGDVVAVVGERVLHGDDGVAAGGEVREAGPGQAHVAEGPAASVHVEDEWAQRRAVAVVVVEPRRAM